MNAAITAALLAAQQSAAPDPVTRLTAAGAVTSASAIAIDPASPAEAKLIEAAIAENVIERLANGRLFVNQRVLEERNARVGYQLVIAALIGVSIAASVAALLMVAPR